MKLLDSLSAVLDTATVSLPTATGAYSTMVTLNSGTVAYHKIAKVIATYAPASSAGEIAIYREATGAETITTTLSDQQWDNTVGTPGTPFTLQGDNASVDLADAGHYLVMYNLALNGSGSGRAEIQGLIDLAGTDIAYGRSTCFIRLAGGADFCWMFGSTIIEATAGQDVKIEAQRTDGFGATVSRRASENGLTLIKLDDSWDYARIQEAGGGQAFDSTTFATVTWDTNDELDTGTFSRTGGDITLATAGHYLVTSNVMFNNSDDCGGSACRRNIATRLTLDGTEIAGTRTTSYLRGAESAIDHVAVYSGIIVTTSANQVLRVQAACDGQACSGTTLTNVGGQSAISIAKLPDTGDYIRLHAVESQEVV